MLNQVPATAFEKWNVLVTGGSGDIGKHLPNNFRYLSRNELNNPTLLTTVLNGSKHLIHLAGIVGENNVKENSSLARRVNIDLTCRLAELFLTYGEGRFLFISTSHVYKRSSNKLDENSAIEPISLYAEQKLEAEMKLLDLFSSDEKRLLILRLFSVLGLSTKPHTLGGLLTRVIQGNQSVISNSKDVRSFLSPNQYANIISRIVSFDKHLPQLINLASKSPLSVGDACKTILSEIGLKHFDLELDDNISQTPMIWGSNDLLKTFFPDLDLELHLFHQFENNIESSNSIDI